MKVCQIDLMLMGKYPSKHDNNYTQFQSAFTCSDFTIDTLEQGLKYVFFFFSIRERGLKYVQS